MKKIITKSDLYEILLEENNHYQVNTTRNDDNRTIPYQEVVKYDGADLEVAENTIREITTNLFDLSQKVVIPFTKSETYVLRKYYGIYNNNIMQTRTSISSELGFKSITTVSNLITEGQIALSNYVQKNVYMSKLKFTDKITSFDFYPELSSLKDMSASEALDSDIIAERLRRHWIYTLEDLMAYSASELTSMKVGSIHLICGIPDRVHRLGLLFAEEITLDDRINLLLNQNQIERTLNSNLGWINKYSSNYNIHTIEDYLKDKITKNESLTTLEKALVEEAQRMYFENLGFYKNVRVAKKVRSLASSNV